MKNKGLICMAVLWVLMVVTLVTFLPQPVQAEEYPSRALTIVVPYSPGGRSDTTARIFAQHMKKYTGGQPVVILNKPGSGSVVGVMYASQSKPDGYTCLAVGSSILTTPHILKSPVTFRDFAVLARVSDEPDVIAVNSSQLPVNNVKELITYGKQHPGEIINSTTTGAGIDIHARAFLAASGMEMRQLSFPAGPERITAVMGGHANCMFIVPSEVGPAVKSGKVKIIGIATEKRHADFPGVHTWKEDGVNLVLSSWQGLYAPKNIPPSILAKLEAIVEKTGQDPECIKAMKAADVAPDYLGPKAFLKAIEEEDQIIQKIVATSPDLQPKKTQ